MTATRRQRRLGRRPRVSVASASRHAKLLTGDPLSLSLFPSHSLRPERRGARARVRASGASERERVHAHTSPSGFAALNFEELCLKKNGASNEVRGRARRRRPVIESGGGARERESVYLRYGIGAPTVACLRGFSLRRQRRRRVYTRSVGGAAAFRE